MKLKLLQFVFSFLLIASNTSAQKLYVYGDRTYGTNKKENPISIVYYGNYKFIIGCSTSANIDGDKTEFTCDSSIKEDLWFINIDSAFNILWNKSVGGYNMETYPRLFAMRNNKNVIFSCLSHSDSSCEKSENNRNYPSPGADYWIGIIDSNGNKIIDRTWGGLGADFFSQIIELNSSELIVAGTSYSPIGGDKTVSNYSSSLTDYWVIKMDSSGNKVWDNVYGGTGVEGGTWGHYYFCLLGVEGSNFILSGTSDSPPSIDITDTCRGLDDIWVIKIDSLGQRIWDRRYGGNFDDSSERIIKSPDSGYIICGNTSSAQGLDVSDSGKGGSDCWIIKLDSMGNKQWDKRFGGNRNEVGIWIENAPGGGYWISCSTNSDSSFDVSENPYGTGDYWLLKIDSIGNKLFDKRFGGPGLNTFPRFVILPDSSIMLCGNATYGTSAVKTDPGYGDWDIWCIHFKYEDTLSSTGIINPATIKMDISVHPNPAKDELVISVKQEPADQGDFILFNATGQKMINIPLPAGRKRISVNVTSLVNGMYSWRVSFPHHSPQHGKLVILR